VTRRRKQIRDEDRQKDDGPGGAVTESMEVCAVIRSHGVRGTRFAGPSIV
jgi:hypothetical protein